MGWKRKTTTLGGERKNSLLRGDISCLHHIIIDAFQVPIRCNLLNGSIISTDHSLLNSSIEDRAVCL